MITRVRITDPEHCGVPWAKDVPWLKDLDVTFSPGLTVIFGPNASGKSTLLTLLARHLHCAQGGAQKVTQTSLTDLLRSSHDAYPAGAVLDHDGAPAAHAQPDRAWRVGGSFDNDFFEEGVADVFRSRAASAGQTAFGRMVVVLKQLKAARPPETTALAGRPAETAARVSATLLGSGGGPFRVFWRTNRIAAWTFRRKHASGRSWPRSRARRGTSS